MLNIKVRKNAESDILELNVDIDPSTLPEATQHYHRDANITVVIQGVLRNMLKGTKTTPAIPANKLQAACDKHDWVKTLTPHARKSNVEKAADLLKGMTDVEREAFIAALTPNVEEVA
jgi:hypothetical protein